VTGLFESSLSIIVLAIVVSVRLVMYLRKRAADKQTRNPPPPLDGISAIEAESAVLDSNEDEDGFSAWALSVEPRGPVPPPPAAPIRDAGFSLEELSSAIPQAAPAPVSAPYIWQGSSPAETIHVSAGARRARADGAFWRKLTALPPLEQGIIMSEILGPPKGL
jgi:hypothetical protein